MKLLHLTFALTIFGILLIILLTNTLQPTLQSISNITTKQLEKQIKTQGTITNIINYNTFQIITIQNQTKINLILSPPSNLTKNQNIIVTGTLQQYKNQLQINANQITVQTHKTIPQNQSLLKSKEQSK